MIVALERAKTPTAMQIGSLDSETLYSLLENADDDQGDAGAGGEGDAAEE